MFNLGPMELLVIVVIALVVLGPQRMPDAMRQVGKGLGEARRWSSQLTSEVQSAFVPGPDPAPATGTARVSIEKAVSTAPVEALPAEGATTGASAEVKA